ncbi:MAG: DNA polymerase IV [Alphaproteobacteria bacterium]|nr:DNA polymerase IV [Alphaproteobacteria bacterium]
MSGFCRDCLAPASPGARRCAACGSPRLLFHEEMDALAIAHLDCDAFYASVEKRDDPALAHRPVIIGGGRRGVVSTACYVARTYGVRSAMPMFKALKACPDAVVIKPNMAKYRDVSRAIRTRMQALTPLVETLSLDEAFLDLSGTDRLHGQCPARVLARLAKEIERDIGITVSIGLSYNKFLAKVASDLRKPRGFAVIGRKEARDFLRERPISTIFGVGKVTGGKLSARGYQTLGQLQDADDKTLLRDLGPSGPHMAALARGQDARRVTPHAPAKSVSAETTFEYDLAKHAELEPVLWRLCERVSARAKLAGIGGQIVTLKLKDRQFHTETRRHTSERPTQLAGEIFKVAHALLVSRAEGMPYRLIGVGISGLSPADACDQPDLLDKDEGRAARAERAIDKLRERFGDAIIAKGRSFKQT